MNNFFNTAPLDFDNFNFDKKNHPGMGINSDKNMHYNINNNLGNNQNNKYNPDNNIEQLNNDIMDIDFLGTETKPNVLNNNNDVFDMEKNLFNKNTNNDDLSKSQPDSAYNSHQNYVSNYEGSSSNKIEFNNKVLKMNSLQDFEDSHQNKKIIRASLDSRIKENETNTIIHGNNTKNLKQLPTTIHEKNFLDFDDLL